MERSDIEFLRKNIEPIKDIYGTREYRAAARLVDGMYLPCVVFKSSASVVNLALKRLSGGTDQNMTSEKSMGLGRYNVIRSLVGGNRVSEIDIAGVEKSRYAFPAAIHEQIRGETSMGWTAFVVRMKDGKIFSFGTSLRTSFFNMPEGYTPDDALELINHSYVSLEGDLIGRNDREKKGTFSMDSVFKAKPFFECYVDAL